MVGISKMNIKKVNLNLLRAFDALMTEKNVTRAGRKIFITQSAMSASLAQLRELFNDPLLVRHKRMMKPTSKAISLMPKIRDILQQIEQTLLPKIFEPHKSTRTFHIGMSDYTEYVLLPELLPLMNQSAPDVKLKISHLNALDRKEAFDEMQLDLGIGVVFNKTPDTLSSEIIYMDTSACVADPRNPIIQNKLTLKKYLQAKHLVVIFPEEPYLSRIDNILDKLGYHRNAVVTLPHMIPGIFSLNKTPYLVTTSTLIAHSLGKSIKLAIQKPPFDAGIIEIKQAWLKHYDNDPAHMWLRKLVNKAASKLPATNK